VPARQPLSVGCRGTIEGAVDEGIRIAVMELGDDVGRIDQGLTAMIRALAMAAFVT
jgi:hypothetical protein